MSGTVTQVIPPRRIEHHKVARPTGVGMSTAPNGTVTLTQSGCLDACSSCRSSWPCLPSKIERLTAENERLRSVLEQIASFDRRALDMAKTLHYDMNGWAKRALLSSESQP